VIVAHRATSYAAPAKADDGYGLLNASSSSGREAAGEGPSVVQHAQARQTEKGESILAPALAQAGAMREARATMRRSVVIERPTIPLTRSTLIPGPSAEGRGSGKREMAMLRTLDRRSRWWTDIITTSMSMAFAR
jgi:hypothetical protein